MKKFSCAIVSVLTASVLFCSCKVPENKVHSIADLEGKTIGVQLGTTGDIYSSDIKDATIERFSMGVDSIQALKLGKIDAAIIDNEPAEEFVEKNDDLEILEEPFVVENYALAMKKDNKNLQEKINNALKELDEEGTLKKIISSWIDDVDYNYTSPENLKYENGTLVMATNSAFPPYEFKENNKIVGIDPDIMLAVADKLDMKLQIEDISFDALIPEIQSGKADVIASGMTVTEERKQNVLFSDSYAQSKQVIIVRKK